MVQVQLTRPFLKSVKKLPRGQQQKLSLLLKDLGNNPFSPSLHKKLMSGPLAGHYSFRITREWRVIFRFIDLEIVTLVRVAHRKDIYR